MHLLYRRQSKEFKDVQSNTGKHEREVECGGAGEL